MLTEPEAKAIIKVILVNGIQYGGKASEAAVLKIVGREMVELRPRMKEIREEIIDLLNDWNTKSLEEFRIALSGLDKGKLKEIEASRSHKEEKPEKSSGIELPPLPGAEDGKVVLRMAPFPSGALHIGNARMVLLNGYYSGRYNGRLVLCYDDTIGSAEKTIDPESYDLIPDALDYLGVKYHEVVYKSDRLPIFYEYTEKLLRMNKMYVCTCNGAEWREEHKITGISCPCRPRGIEENLNLWQKMLDGEYQVGQAVVRLKTGMEEQKDPALRDQVALRISEALHPRVGDKYRVWPLLEFSWGIDDHLLGMTHIIRGIDLVKEGTIEKIIWDWFGWKNPEIILHGRVKTEGFTISKSKAAKDIREGKYSGWDDPRTWSLQSLRRRGYLPKALWNAILSLGIGPNAVKLSPVNLYHANRELVDNAVSRVFAIEQPVPITIEEVPRDLPEVITMANHPTNPNLGTHELHIGKATAGGKLSLVIESADAERLKSFRYARLMHLFNIEVTKVTSTGVTATYYGDDHTFIYENKYPFIHWLPKTNFLTVPLTLENGSVSKISVEPIVQSFAKGTLMQLVRKEFVAKDNAGNEVSLIFAHR